jgi:hypothetical protein
LNTGQPNQLKLQWGIFTHLPVGATVPSREDDTPADHVTTVWLAEICNGKKEYREIHISFSWIGVRRTIVHINTQKIIKLELPEMQTVTNHAICIIEQYLSSETSTASTFPESLLENLAM